MMYPDEVAVWDDASSTTACEGGILKPPRATKSLSMHVMLAPESASVIAVILFTDEVATTPLEKDDFSNY